MSHELHYTSAPRGLTPGSKGFCTVARTANLPGPLEERLEGLSGYRQVFSPHDASASQNPVTFSHLKVNVGGRTWTVLSRVGSAGLDYSDRSNKYGHHVVLDDEERPEGGPAWVLTQPGFMESAWEGEPRVLASGRLPRLGDRPPGVCNAWQACGGDAGWGGVLAESFLEEPETPVVVVFRPGMDTLPLVVEALALVPPGRRWEVTFCTYDSALPQGMACHWRFVLDGSPEAVRAERLPNARIVSLVHPQAVPRESALVRQARSGLPSGSALGPPPLEFVEGPPGASPQSPWAHATASGAFPETWLDLESSSLRPRSRRGRRRGWRKWAWFTAAFILTLGIALGAAWYLGWFRIVLHPGPGQSMIEFFFTGTN